MSIDGNGYTRSQEPDAPQGWPTVQHRAPVFEDEAGRRLAQMPLGGWEWAPEYLDESDREWLRRTRHNARRRVQLLAGLSLGIVAGLVLGFRRWRRV